MSDYKGSDCYCISLRRAANAITKFYDEGFKESGLTVSQYSLLNNLSKLQTASITKLAEVLKLDRTTVTRNICSLFDAGLIEDISQSNKRDRMIQLTELGREVVVSGRSCWIKTQSIIQDVIGQEDLDCFMKTLQKLGNIDDQIS